MAKRDLKVAWFNEGSGEFHTPKVRLVYPTLLEPRGIKGVEGSKPKFSTLMLVPKGSDTKVLIAGMEAAMEDKHGKKWRENKKLLKPFENTADHNKLKEYADEYPLIIKASANPDYPPSLFGPDATLLTADTAKRLVYGGRWAVVSGTFYGYPASPAPSLAKGVNFGMRRVQLLADAARIGGGGNTSNDGFEAIDEDDAELDAWDPAA